MVLEAREDWTCRFFQSIVPHPNSLCIIVDVKRVKRRSLVMANVEVIIHIYVELATGTVHLLCTDVPVLAAMQNTNDSRSRE